MNALHRVAVFALLALAAACTTVPVQNFDSKVPGGLTKEQVREAILNAAEERLWVAKDESPAVLLATLVVRRKHSATVAIAYDASHYTITYRDSTNLDYENGEIHENYNEWVTKLDRTIQKELYRAASARH